MVRLVFTADNHLSKTYSLMTPDQLAARRERLRQAWIETVDFALREGADFYLHGGDLFDNIAPRNAETITVGSQIMRLHDAGIPIYMIGGNHDVPRSLADGATPQRLFSAVRRARVFSRRTAVEWEVHDVRGTRVAIGGLPFDPRVEPGDDPLAEVDDLEPPAGVDYSVLMLHYAVEGTLPGDINEPVLTKERIASLRGVHLLLVGHVHQRLTQRIGDVIVAYSGPTERMNFGELGVETGFIEATLGPQGVQVRHHNTRAQAMLRDTVRTSDLPEDATEALRARIHALSKPDQLFQLRIEGPLKVDDYRRLRWAELRVLGAESNFFFDLDTRPMHLVHRRELPVGAGGERVSPREEVDAIAAAWSNDGADDTERELIEAARQFIVDRL